MITVRISAHGGVGRETGQVPGPHVPHIDVFHGVNENHLLGQDEANDVLPTNDGKDDYCVETRYVQRTEALK